MDQLTSIKIDNECVISFDDCSLINSLKISVPRSIRILFDGKSELVKDNYTKLMALFTLLESHKINKYRFVETELEQNCLKALNELIGTRALKLQDWVTKEFKDQFNKQMGLLKSKFKTIKLIENNTDALEQLFTKNRRSLKRIGEIPEKDDLKIMKTLHGYPSKNDKYIISFDEHFWGYKDLIESNLDFKVIEEWNCHQITCL